jgi:hypothetical protein
MSKVAIIGRCDNTRDDAPWFDPTWEKWGLAWDAAFMGDLYFETHVPATWHDNMLAPSPLVTYTDWLKTFPTERPDDQLVLLDHYFPGVMRYPMESVRADWLLCRPGTHEPYLESSIAYMLAMAKVLGKRRVAVFGIDMTSEDEYTYQRPNLAYLVGALRYAGVRVNVPKGSAMWELIDLDQVFPDYMDPDAPRHYLEYCLGRDRARGMMPKKYRADLMTSAFVDPPMYGFHEMKEVVIDGKRVFLDKSGDPLPRFAETGNEMKGFLART